jgi:hypothetical protein
MFRRLGAAAAMVALVFSLCGAPVAAQTAAPLLIVGGTPAGVAAAVAAARDGVDSTLVAKGSVLGGILTDAMMDQWDLNVAPDGDPIQGGIFREIHAALGDAFTPQAAAAEFGALVAHEPRVHLITDARVVAVVTAPDGSERSITAVRFRAADGRTFEIAANRVIDATDDGDVAALAGARYDLGRQDTGIDEGAQAVTLMFTVRGVDWQQLTQTYDTARFGPGGALDRRAWGYAALLAAYRAHEPGVLVRDLNLGREPDGEVTVNAIDVLGIDGLDDAQRERARVLSEAEAPHLIAFLRERLPGFSDATLGRFAAGVYVRETRHFLGRERLTADDVWDGAIPSDTIGLSSYPLDLHPVTATQKQAYAPVRHVYGVPFGTMVPLGVTNVLLASPSISATHVAAGSARVIPTTIEEGEAAGEAAALSQHANITFAAMAGSADAISGLRAALRDDGVILTYRTPSPLAIRTNHRSA